MTTVSCNRKRTRSDDNNSYSLQSKIFVNQQLIDSQNEDKMKQIHGRTVNLLFQGLKNLYTTNSNNNNNNNLKLNKIELMKKIKLNGNGNIQYENGIKPLEVFESQSKSKCCNKIAVINSECTNCNLQLCEYCGYSCIECGIHLCGACVTIFGCGTIDEPSCSNCKIFS